MTALAPTPLWRPKAVEIPGKELSVRQMPLIRLDQWYDSSPSGSAGESSSTKQEN